MLATQLSCCRTQVASGTAVASSLSSTQLATLPLGLLALCATAATLTAQRLIGRLGRRPLFMGAASLGIVGAALACVAVRIGSFALLLVAAAPQGVAYGVSNLYRFMAVEVVVPAHKERALAASVGGAVLAAFIGPEASRHVRESLEPTHLASFILSAGLYTAQVRFM